MRSMLHRGESTLVLWFLPMVGMIGIFLLFPVIEAVRYSFTDSFLTQPTYSYTLRAYIDLFTSKSFYEMLKTTLIFALSSAFLQLIVGLLIALLIEAGEKRNLFSALITRTVVFSAWVIPGVVVGLIWKILLTDSNYGLVNYLLEELGFRRLPFLYVPSLALFSIVIADVWRGTALSMILEYAGLKKIPSELYEAAYTDGASKFQVFRYITLPLLSFNLMVNLVLVTISALNTFDMIYSLTGGGPGRATETLAISTYHTVFTSLYLGKGSAIGVILLAINLVLALIYYKLLGKEQLV